MRGLCDDPHQVCAVWCAQQRDVIVRIPWTASVSLTMRSAVWHHSILLCSPKLDTLFPLRAGQHHTTIPRNTPYL